MTNRDQVAQGQTAEAGAEVESTEAGWTLDGADYPRKQMRRRRWMNLDGDWQFAFDHDMKFRQPDQVDAWPLSIRVPFAPESRASGIGDEAFHPRCWYQRDFEIVPTGQVRYILHFGAVDYCARVWLNGHYIGCHEGGHTPFCFDVTDELKTGVQTLVVRVDDDPFDLAKPRGKQDWQLQPHSIWYPRTTGIWQTVWIEEVPEVYIDHVRWTPLLERWEIGCEVFVSGETTGNLELRVCLKCDDQCLVDDTYRVIRNEVHRRIALSDPGIDDYRNELLWSPEKPTLIDAEISLWRDGQEIDRVESYTALRSVAISRDRFTLNGRPYSLRMVLDQGYWPETLMTPPSSRALRKDVELVKAAGFNGVRKHQKIEHPDFLYWADKLGLLVWEEMPSAYRFTHESVQRITREWMEVIDRDSNHPSVIVWVPFNESWGVPDLAEKVAHQSCVQAMYHLTRTLDPTRPVIGNDGWESTATDILGIHDYDSNPERLKGRYESDHSLAETLKRGRPGGRILTVEGYEHCGQPIMLTEFGGIAYTELAKTESASTWGYSTTPSRAELSKRYTELLKAVHATELFSGFCYTQFTDTFQEANGLFFADRTPKFPIKEMAAATTGEGFRRAEISVPPGPAVVKCEGPNA